ncbi:contains similarity several bacterial glutathione-regulated potassium efflux system proteins [Ectocarpus siliculosus]|uniref:Contains similarity several bacterial glutathione-regulated potassium efflux system proteins n=1 Tax=Ectocarpus siliculosus TaxID=2880 RepID=D7FKF7_ECTSI|nr:contains similarity several bacterial glutathione-regulated potassium efflux system proteins [Ectocarpus siliculosus]|eukprot:CBJ29359.1 contains similarity several bacterial glutathione-regulated potassium efflux system proteins [Ectocarpus siliculosus]
MRTRALLGTSTRLQGRKTCGEFAFVVLSLSQRLGVLPDELNRLLIGVVVLSMALTPALSELGDLASEKLIEAATKSGMASAVAGLELKGPAGEGEGKGLGGQEKVVICGFGPVGQIVGSLLSTPVIKDKLGADYVAFDLNPIRVRQSMEQGFPVFYGDGTEPEVLKTAGMGNPKAIVVTYSNKEVSNQAVERLHQAFPGTPIFVRATDYEQYLSLQDFGATAVVSDLR